MCIRDRSTSAMAGPAVAITEWMKSDRSARNDTTPPIFSAIPDMMVVITGATAEIADPIPPATAPMIPAACWMVGTRVMITGPMPDMAVVTAGAIWLNPDEILLTKLDATGRAVDARLLMTGTTWLNADLAAPTPLLRFCPNDADSFWITGWALSLMEMVSDKTGFNCSTIPVSYTHLDVYKRQPSSSFV